MKRSSTNMSPTAQLSFLRCLKQNAGECVMNENEQAFISRCIANRMQERLLYELNGKKRRDGLGRFSHGTDKLLLPEKIILKKKISKDEIISVIGKARLSEACHIAAFNTDLDKLNCSVSEALELVLGNGMPAVIIMNSLAIIETEQCSGTPVRYIVQL